MSRFKFFGSYVAFLSFMGGWIAGVPASAQAGQETHGGHAVVCKDPSTGAVQSIQLLDHFEGGYSLKAQLEMGQDLSDYKVVARYILDRLALVDPLAAERFQERVNRFEEEMVLLDESKMKEVADSNEVLRPGSNCYKTQFVVQITHPRFFEMRYLVNQQLWEQADAMTKAGIVLHEVIFTDAVEHFQQTTSDAVRYYNYVISSDLMRGMSAGLYFSLLNDCGFLNPSPAEFRREMFSIIIDSIPVVARGGLNIFNDRATVPHLQRPVAFRLAWDGPIVHVKRGSEVTYDSGRINWLPLEAPVVLGKRHNPWGIDDLKIEAASILVGGRHYVMQIEGRYHFTDTPMETRFGTVMLTSESCPVGLDWMDGDFAGLREACVKRSVLHVPGGPLTVQGVIVFDYNGAPLKFYRVEGGFKIGDTEYPAVVKVGRWGKKRYKAWYSVTFKDGVMIGAEEIETAREPLKN